MKCSQCDGPTDGSMCVGCAEELIEEAAAQLKEDLDNYWSEVARGIHDVQILRRA